MIRSLPLAVLTRMLHWESAVELGALQIASFQPFRVLSPENREQETEFGVSIKQNNSRDQLGRGGLIGPEVELCRRNPFSNSPAWSWS
jgi:hypothetical protein